MPRVAGRAASKRTTQNKVEKAPAAGTPNQTITREMIPDRKLRAGYTQFKVE